MPSLPNVYKIHSFAIQEERNQLSIDNSLDKHVQLKIAIISGVPAMM